MIERYSRPEMKKVWSDEYKFRQWLRIEIAACEAWAKIGKIPSEAIPKIKRAKFKLERVNELLKITHHDMTAFINAVSENLGEEGRYIHYGMTSSDVMDTALSLQVKEASKILINDMQKLIATLQNRAIEHKSTLMVGRTHGVHAEPITFGLKLALWTEESKRNLQRLIEASRNMNVGKISGAVGTYATIPPEIEQIVCKKLGLKPAPNSNQIIQRDRHAQFITTLAIIASSLEKFATEIRALQKTEVLELEEPFTAGQTGSSAMPHKKNPELCERICGLARLVRGYALTSMENIALWHERDISHSSNERVIFPDACILLDYILNIFNGIMKNLKINVDNMKRNLDLTHGLLFSQRVLLTLIEKGLSRKEAYEVVQKNAMKAWQGRTGFLNLLKSDKTITKLLSEKELNELFDYSYFTKYVDYIFKRLNLTNISGSDADKNNLTPLSV